MALNLGIGGAIALIGTAVGFVVARKLDSAKYEIKITQARAKAKAIEHEAELKLKNIHLQEKEAELAARKKYEEKLKLIEQEYEKKELELKKRVIEIEKKDEDLNNLFKDELKNITKEKQEIKTIKSQSEALYKKAISIREEYEEKLKETKEILEKISGFTEEEAKNLILTQVEENSRADIAHIVRKYEELAKKESEKRANYIIAQATTRFAGEFAAERLINVISLTDDELKGRIIGKEGRNIKTLEMLLGVDIIIDDTPNIIVISSFNLYRRAIAVEVIEQLIKDGRIQPARIEAVYEKVKENFDKKLLEEGENIVMDLGIGQVHPEILKLIGRLKFRASYGQNALGHSLEVAHLAGIMTAELGGDDKLARRAGLLHDIGKALTHEYSGSHVDLGAEICKRYNESEVVLNAIYAHHGHEEAKTIEAATVCAADSLSAARPGARREVLESFLKRVKAIEEIATSKRGVTSAYAISAGREIRVILNANLVNENESSLLAKEIAKEIEESVQYPGDIKINVIRETRIIEYAK